MRRVLLLTVAALLLCLPGMSEAQSCDGCGIGYRPSSLGSSGGTLTGPLILSNGSAAAPSAGFALDTDTGFYMNTGSGRWFFNPYPGGAASVTMALFAKFVFFSSDTVYGWTGDTAAATALDTIMVREAAANVQFGLDAATATAQTLSAADSTGAAQPGAQFNLSGGTGGAGGEPGAVAIVDGGTKPTCAAGIRGSIWYDAGAGGVADSLEVCAKSAADAYAWRAMATIP